MKGVEASAKYSRSQETASKESNQYGVEQTEFLAVNSSGSWSEHGFQADHNTGYPILLDLRPLEELLNPIYFADEPEVVSIVRPKLHAAIQSYLNSRPKPSDVSRFPEVWRFSANKITCVASPFDGQRPGLDMPLYLAAEKGMQNLKGSLDVVFLTPEGMKSVAKISPFKTEEGVTKEMDCGTHGSVDLVAGSTATLFGTREQIAATKFMLVAAIFEEDSKAEDFFRSDIIVGDDPVALGPSAPLAMPNIPGMARIATGRFSREYAFPKLNMSAPVIKLEYTLERLQ